MLLLLWWWCPYANACCGMAIATAVSAMAAVTIAAIAEVLLMWFISHTYDSTLVYLRYFTTSAKNIEGFADIVNH